MTAARLSGPERPSRTLDDVSGSPRFRDDPYPVYKRLREEDPVHWSDAWSCWVLTRYDDIASVLRDPRRFSSRGRVTNVIEREFPGHFLDRIRPLLEHFSKGLINVDPPDHTRLRKLVQKTFVPKTLERLRPHVQSLVDEILDRACERGEMDVVADLAFPLPVTVFAGLLGVPPLDRDRFKHWTHAALEFQAVPRPDPEAVLRSQAAILEMREYLRGVVRERRASPEDDLLSDLAAVEEEGDRLNEDELLSTGVSLLVAGHETTTNLIASAVLLFLKHPEQLERLRGEPSLLPAAIEETLRFEGPLQRIGRTATEDATIGGRLVRKGETVLSLLGAANRDPAQFADPERFDILRAPNRHIAFGHGIHFCLGAALARFEAPIALRAIFERLPHLRIATDPIEWHSGVMRGPKELHVRF